ncbi:MAG: PilZ domain-containing protein [Chloroflexota bacterium]
MQDTNLIAYDLRMCLIEGKRHFDFLNIYRGIQFVSETVLESVLEDRAIFSVQSPSAVLLERDKASIVLSNGLIDPFAVRVDSFDMDTGRLVIADMAYVGDTVGNRHEHRLEVTPALPVDIDLEGVPITAELVDISLSGAGLHLPAFVSEFSLQHGRRAWLTLHLPEGNVHILGEFLRFRKIFNHYWAAAKFTGVSAGKNLILHYINRRLNEVRLEVQQMYTEARQAKILPRDEE